MVAQPCKHIKKKLMEWVFNLKVKMLASHLGVPEFDS